MIVEDDPMAARHLEMVLDKMEEIFISYVIENALMAEAYCCREHIDLILMDVCTAMNASGLEAAVKIKKNFPAVKILILTSQLDPELLRRAREAKIEGFCYKLSDDSEITAAIHLQAIRTGFLPCQTRRALWWEHSRRSVKNLQ